MFDLRADLPARSWIAAVLAATGLTLACAAFAAQTVPVDPALCRNDRLFAHGFGEDADVEVGLLTRGFNNRTYYLVVPASYRAGTPTPLLLALHGTGGSPAAAQANALAIAQTWRDIARTRGMIVAVPIGSSPQGSWNPPLDIAYLDGLRASLASEFDLDPTRNYLWGFSAGGHFGHGFTLQRTDSFAAYAIAAGVLRGYACTAETCPDFLAAVPRRIPVDISSGTGDPVVPLSEISADEGRFRDAGWQSGSNLWVRGLNQGHTYSSPQLATSWDTICRFAVIQDP